MIPRRVRDGMGGRISRINRGHCKGEEATLWRGTLCLIYTKVLCLWKEEPKMKLQQEAGDKGSEQRGIDGWLQRKKAGESGNMSMSLNGSSTLAVQQYYRSGCWMS